MKKLTENLFNKTTYVLYVISMIFAIIFGILRQNFLLNFINGLTFAGFIFLAFGLFRNSWARGEYSFFTWKPSKAVRNRAPGEVIPDADKNPAQNKSYRAYREYIAEQRKDTKNPLLYAGGLITIVAIILSLLY